MSCKSTNARNDPTPVFRYDNMPFCNRFCAVWRTLKSPHKSFIVQIILSVWSSEAREEDILINQKFIIGYDIFLNNRNKGLSQDLYSW